MSSSRVSFQKFSSGLPVQRENPVAPEATLPDKPNMVGRVLSDIPSDAVESFKGSFGAIKDGFNNVKEAFTKPGLSIPQRAAGALVAPFSAGVNVVAEGVKGAAKLLTTDEFESSLSAAVSQAGESVMSTEAAQKLVQMYASLPEDQKYTLSNIIAPMANVMSAGAGGVTAGPVLNTLKTGVKDTFKTGVKSTVKRTSKDAAEAIVTAANPVVETAGNPIVDTIKGIGTQIKDFGRRTVNEAQDTAAESRKLAQMPPAKASLVKNGADERIVNVIEKGTPEEVKIYRELVDHAKKKELDPTPNTPQPKAIAGREFLKPVDYIINERKSVGAKLGEYRKNLDTNKTIDTNPAFRAFHEHLKTNFKVQFDTDGKIIENTGTLASSDVKLVQKIYDQLRSDKKNSQAELDQWLQRTYKDYDLVQARERTFSEEVPRIADFARSEVRKLMPEDYNQLATDYAKLSRPLTEFVKLVGYKGDINKLTAKELKTGEIALRVLGNAADRPQSVIDDVLDTATEAGYKSNIDLNRLIYVTDQLEDLYDITPSRGFSGSATRGINQSSVGVAGDMATMNLPGLFNRAMSSRASQKEIQASFEEYLKFLDEGEKPKPTSFNKGENPQTNTPEVVQTEVSKMIEKAPEARAYIDDIVTKLSASISDARPVVGVPIKSVARSVQKTIEEEAGDYTKLKDLARNSIVPMTTDARDAAIDALSKRPDLARAPKIQTPEQFSGYAGVIFNIKAPNGLISEIQVVEPHMIFGKMLPKDGEAILGKELFDQIAKETGQQPGYGHEIYEKMRSLSVAELEGPKGQQLRQESIDYYNKLR